MSCLCCVCGGGDDDCNDFSTDSHLLTVLQTFAVALNHCLQLPQQHLVINHDVDDGDDGVDDGDDGDDGVRRI